MIDAASSIDQLRSKRISAIGRRPVGLVAALLLGMAASLSHGQESNGQVRSVTKPAKDSKVLRHAVFFKFRENATSDEVQKVVNAFRVLPETIDAIEDFQWGTNNSREGLDDGFTHGFLLTFRDEKGREEYLPHEDHRSFGAILRPHLDDVFVIDYWGQSEPSPDRALKHAVFFRFRDDAPAASVKAVEDAFAALPEKIDAIKAFEWGRNNSPEGHDDGFTHCFMVTFDSEEGRAAYLPHPAHQDFVEVLRPVLDKVRVIDFWAQR